MFSHEAFAKELGGLPFELIADFERKMVTDYGVRRDDAVYVIDRSGTVRWSWERSKDQPQPDYDLVIAEAKKVSEVET